MKFLFISVFGESLALMQTLLDDGEFVRCFIKDQKFRSIGRGIVPHVLDWKKHIDWADILVFDDADLGQECEKVRARGYIAVGGNRFGDKLENVRLFGQKILLGAGIKFPKSRRFTRFSSAIRFIKTRRKRRYVLKFNGQLARYKSYIGRFDEGSDMVEMLEHYQETWSRNKRVDFILQEYIYGIEIGCGAFFNGRDFAYPINITFEHKQFLTGGIGPLTPEMGTSMYYSEDGGKLFRETLLKMQPYLARTNYRGFIDLNCMVNENAAYALEFTTRFGYPQLDIQLALHKTPWGELLHKIADGTLEKFDVHYDFAVGVVLGGAGIPFEIAFNKYGRNLPIFGLEKVSKKQAKLSEVYMRDGKYFCTGFGYPVTIIGCGETMRKAQDDAYQAVRKITIPNCIYRIDIGDHWEKEAPQLKKWGYL